MLNSLTRLWRRTPNRARRPLVNFRPAVEALGERVTPSVTGTLTLPGSAGVAGIVAQNTQTLRVDGTFNVTNVHGSEPSSVNRMNLPKFMRAMPAGSEIYVRITGSSREKNATGAP